MVAGATPFRKPRVKGVAVRGVLISFVVLAVSLPPSLAQEAGVQKRIPSPAELKQIAAVAREKHRDFAQSDERWQRHGKDKPRHMHLYIKDAEVEGVFYNFSVSRDLKAQNQWLRQRIAGGKDLHLPWLNFFGARSRHFPGRLETDVEKILKDRCFKEINRGPKASAQLRDILGRDDGTTFIMDMHNLSTRGDAYHYRKLEYLKDDPEYKNKKLEADDTISQRYRLYTEYYRRGLKRWALHGLFVELGSGHYEYKTFRGLQSLLDFAEDPVVAARIRMFMDIALVENQQITLSGRRGGSKSRAKKGGGMHSRYDGTLACFYGERPGGVLEPPGMKSYQAPDAAILLRRLGPTQPVYEICNRLPGETAKAGLKLLSRAINYAYCTPEYVTGCVLFDPNIGYTRGSFGRWIGVTFRDRGAVYLEPYFAKRTVQHKDVMIAQRLKHFYQGDPNGSLVRRQDVFFTSGWDMVEKDDWVFVSNDEAYAAVKIVKGGYTWKEPARHLLMKDRWSPIIIQTGRKVVYGSVGKFQEAILKAPLTLTKQMLRYTGPSSPTIEFFPAEAPPYKLPKIDGKALNVNPKYNYRSPYIGSKAGSDIVTVRYGSRRWVYDFGKNTIAEIADERRSKRSAGPAAALAATEKLVSAKRYGEAIRRLRQLAKWHAGADVGKRASVRLKALLDDPAIARSVIDDKADALEARCATAERKKDYALAIRLYEQYIQQFSKATRFVKVKARLAALKADSAVVTAARLDQAHKECKKWLALAESYAESGRKDKARQYLKKIIEKYGDTDWGAKARARLAEMAGE